MSAMSLSGIRTSLPRLDRAHALTPRQSTHLRNARWLFLAEVGTLDPVTGRARPWSTREIADFCRCSARLVQQGIVEARRVRGLAEAARHA